jgi:hypothetical protein
MHCFFQMQKFEKYFLQILFLFKLKIYKSVHHHIFQISQPTRYNDFSSILLDVMCSSTCFGRPHAHHQELNNCSRSLWFYRWSVVVTVLLVAVGPTGPTATNTALLPPRSNGKTRGFYCSC